MNDLISSVYLLLCFFYLSLTVGLLLLWPQDSPMLTPARQYLTLRSLGAPAILIALAMQGVFRGLKDTKTPLFATSKQ